jgi:putative PIN family toxin of toxin-antitoxin system
MEYMETLTVVLDTNIFVAALLGPSGASRKILRKCLQGYLHPVMGNALFCEYEDLLQREHLFRSCLLSSAEREELFDAFLSVCRWVTIYYGWRPNLRDEADNHIVELAVAGGADFLITKNTKDFKDTELRFTGFQVIKPEQFLQEGI